ncbi:GOLPH3/VPS74 family protein [Dactylosporangium sp. CA-233914]|uniref:GOLPH3/VPS74 family protein n=1 Tax=Dactylosporangium sp. CA-233914 TaxID=3239934 RepID=UPI003D8ECEE9
MAVPHSLPQRIFLLAYNPDKGRVGLGTYLGAMLRAAALADLYRGGHLTDERGRAAVRTVRQQLNDGGWVHLQPHRILGLFPTTKVTIRDPRVRKELLDRVNTALHNPIGSIDPADAALVAIIAAGDLKLVLDRKTRRASKQRIQELTKLSGPIGPALHSSIQAAAIGEV